MSNTARTPRVIGSVIAAGAVLMGSIGVAGAAPPPKYQVTVSDEFDEAGNINFVVATIPPVVPAGTYKVGFANNSVAPHVLITYKIPNGWTTAQFLEALNSGAPPPADAFEVGAIFAKPGQDHQKQANLTLPGTYGYFCPIAPPGGEPHFNEGFVGVFDVVA
jgi:hypothetical protein